MPPPLSARGGARLVSRGVRPPQAERIMLEKGENKEYLPMDGLPAFREATLALLLGGDNPAVKSARTAT